MPVVVIAALILAVSAVSLPSGPVQPFAIKDDARPHLGLMLEMSWNNEPKQTLPIDRREPTDTAQSLTLTRQDTAQVAPPAVVERAAEPAGMPGAIILVAIAIVMTIGIIEVLFRCTIHERPRSTDHRQTE